MYDYKLIRSRRKTLAIHINDDLSLTVKAPYLIKKSEIDKFVLKHSAWIEKHKMSISVKQSMFECLTEEDIKTLKRKAYEYLTDRVRYFGAVLGVTPKKITVTSAKKRFGSCNSKNEICFSYLLMLYPNEAIDYVVVHELAHIKEHNHSKDFYKIIEEAMPDYKEREKVLKKI